MSQIIQNAFEPVAQLPDILSDPKRRRTVSSVALKLFLRLTESWGLNGTQQMRLLGDVPRPTFQRWKKRLADGQPVELDRDQLERISLCLGVEKGLKTIFADEAAGLRWLLGANTDQPFHGLSPADKMSEGGIIGMHATRQYLDAWRGIR
ncbi:antitoxin Xre-like helix-turn-helix domain-containing protein [Parvularcula sp. IMCC14364]|uniref:antitoxin Xre-like helix-turn-helix domain-containing protein n=1 Tax=Parvularcula sp. IMCC14364 TaxID=3067902 RepID=UPI002740F7B6|nr:antitoxin Xre-like helix-turn-helix domain-containing protein [Parvularcula sp. IMCC14364]